jgi:hypothetical protein
MNRGLAKLIIVLVELMKYFAVTKTSILNE